MPLNTRRKLCLFFLIAWEMLKKRCRCVCWSQNVCPRIWWPFGQNMWFSDENKVHVGQNTVQGVQNIETSESSGCMARIQWPIFQNPVAWWQWSIGQIARIQWPGGQILWPGGQTWLAFFSYFFWNTKTLISYYFVLCSTISLVARMHFPGGQNLFYLLAKH